jgi:hypothetical protein
MSPIFKPTRRKVGLFGLMLIVGAGLWGGWGRYQHTKAWGKLAPYVDHWGDDRPKLVLYAGIVIFAGSFISIGTRNRATKKLDRQS